MFFSTDYFEADVDKAHVHMRSHQGAKVKHFDVSNVIYHKFSHGAVFYTLSGENVKVMLEYKIIGKNDFPYTFKKKIVRH